MQTDTSSDSAFIPFQSLDSDANFDKSIAEPIIIDEGYYTRVGQSDAISGLSLQCAASASYLTTPDLIFNETQHPEEATGYLSNNETPVLAGSSIPYSPHNAQEEQSDLYQSYGFLNSNPDSYGLQGLLTPAKKRSRNEKTSYSKTVKLGFLVQEEPNENLFFEPPDKKVSELNRYKVSMTNFYDVYEPPFSCADINNNSEIFNHRSTVLDTAFRELDETDNPNNNDFHNNTVEINDQSSDMYYPESVDVSFNTCYLNNETSPQKKKKYKKEKSGNNLYSEKKNSDVYEQHFTNTVPGVYFDRHKKGFRVRFQNIYVGWVCLSGYSSYEEAYLEAKRIRDAAIYEVTAHQNKQAAINAGISLEIQRKLKPKNPGGRPRTVSRLSSTVDAQISAFVNSTRENFDPYTQCN